MARLGGSEAGRKAATRGPLASPYDGPLWPRVSVVIPHFNDLDALVTCVGLLEAQTYPRASFEIIVADNNSRCGLDEIRMRVPTATVIGAPLQGAGLARNAGVAAASGEILAFIDSDCMADKDWLRAGVASLSRTDFAGGRVVATCRYPAQPNAIEAFEMVFAFDFKRYITKVGFTGTGNMFVPRDVFDEVGPFRSGLSEDIDWSHRARAKGFRLDYVPDALVKHPARRNWDDLMARWSRMLDEQFALACERRFGRLKWAGAGLLMPISIIPHSVRAIRSDRLPGFNHRLGAVAVLVRLRLWRTAKMLKLLVPGYGHAKSALRKDNGEIGRPSSV